MKFAILILLMLRVTLNLWSEDVNSINETNQISSLVASIKNAGTIDQVSQRMIEIINESQPNAALAITRAICEEGALDSNKNLLDHLRFLTKNADLLYKTGVFSQLIQNKYYTDNAARLSILIHSISSKENVDEKIVKSIVKCFGKNDNKADRDILIFLFRNDLKENLEMGLNLLGSVKDNEALISYLYLIVSTRRENALILAGISDLIKNNWKSQPATLSAITQIFFDIYSEKWTKNMTENVRQERGERITTIKERVLMAKVLLEHVSNPSYLGVITDKMNKDLGEIEGILAQGVQQKFPGFEKWRLKIVLLPPPEE